MRTPLVTGNWKMNKRLSEALELQETLRQALAAKPHKAEVVLALPAPYLALLAQRAEELQIASQDVSAHQASGAHTGEYSADMLTSCGVRYAIVGHSERRADFKETDELISKKIEACVAAGLAPIYCCGESLSEREAGRHQAVVSEQLRRALAPFTTMPAGMVVAYEPVWAIGTGKTASTSEAQEMHSYVRQLLAERFGPKAAEATRILYGGSCKPSNAAELFAQADIDGGLIGGASLSSSDFLQIIESAG